MYARLQTIKIQLENCRKVDLPVVPVFILSLFVPGILLAT